MARKKFYIGSAGPFLFDDADPINDQDGDFIGKNRHALSTNSQFLIEEPATADDHALRKADVSDAISAQDTFTNADLASGVLTITHTLGEKYLHVTIWNNSDDVIAPDGVTAVDTTTTTVDLTSYGAITGTWNYRISL